MSNLTILSKEIRQFDDLYCLNDLHKASGGERKHAPSRFVRNEQTQGLIAQIDQNPNLGSAVKVVNGGRNQGTYACKQVVLAYGMWISSELYLAVINAFLEKQEQKNQLPTPIKTLTPAQQRHIQERVAEIVNSDEFLHTYQSLYSKIKSYFKVGTYKDIPEYRYVELCKLLRCKPVDDEISDMVTVKHTDIMFLVGQLQNYKSLAGKILHNSKGYAETLDQIENTTDRRLMLEIQ